MKQISSYLQNFKWINANKVASCRCVICGDSQKKKSKSRFYFYPNTKGTALSTKCHNCGHSSSFSLFVKEHFPQYYAEYKLTCIKERDSGSDWDVPVPTSQKKSAEKTPAVGFMEVPLSDLPANHPAYQYLVGRSIPHKHFRHLYFVPDFCAWVQSVTDEYSERHLPNDPRILMKLMTGDGKLVGVNARAILEDAIRYITLKFDDKESKLYGRERVDQSLPVFVTEGPIDSLFLRNSIALCGGDVGKDLEGFDKNNLMLVFDNEPRSKDTVKRMEKAIRLGFKVCFWNVDSKYKDINDMVLKAGMKAEDIEEMLKRSCSKGLCAKIQLSNWKKI